jgi:hypothetical protein
MFGNRSFEFGTYLRFVIWYLEFDSLKEDSLGFGKGDYQR